MKKILVTQELYSLLDQERSFLDRTDIRVFAVLTNDELLKVHREERADLIITQLDMPGIPTDRMCAAIREDAGLREVSMIMTCANTARAIKASTQCRANAVLLEPLHPVVVVLKAQQLLSIAARETLRVGLQAKIDGRAGGSPFFCTTRNISASGLLVETDRRLADGDRLSLRFSLPGERPIEASGKIIRSGEPPQAGGQYHYGIMFTDLDPAMHQVIAAYVEAASRSATGAEADEG
jgi:DNA-binding response OmpR family regulator